MERKDGASMLHGITYCNKCDYGIDVNDRCRCNASEKTTEEKINKTCAEFMGLKFVRIMKNDIMYEAPDSLYAYQKCYTKSVDACLGLIKKVRKLYELDPGAYIALDFLLEESPALALSTTISKIILELENKGK